MRREKQVQVITLFVVVYLLVQIALMHANGIDYSSVARAIGY